jgi:hypothetical protein
LSLVAAVVVLEELVAVEAVEWSTQPIKVYQQELTQ